MRSYHVALHCILPLPESMRKGNTKQVVSVVDVRKRTTLEEYVKEIIKENNKES